MTFREQGASIDLIYLFFRKEVKNAPRLGCGVVDVVGLRCRCHPERASYLNKSGHLRRSRAVRSRRSAHRYLIHPKRVVAGRLF